MDQNNLESTAEPAREKTGLDRFAHLTPSIGGGFSDSRDQDISKASTIDDLIQKPVEPTTDQNASTLAFAKNRDDSGKDKSKTESKFPAGGSKSASPSKEGGKNDDEEFMPFEDKKSSNIGLAFVWIAALVAVGGAIFFYLIGNSAVSKLAEVNDQKNSVSAQVSSSTYSDVTAKAAGFKAAVEKMSQAKADRFPMSDFLPQIYTAIDKNVTLTSLSLSADGKLSFSGTTNSYKSAAEQLATLKAWQVNSQTAFGGVTLDSYSQNISDKGAVTVPFSISGQLNKTVFTSPVNITTGTTATSGQTVTTGNTATSGGSL